MRGFDRGQVARKLAQLALAMVLGCNTPSVPIPPPVVDLAAIQVHSAPPSMVVIDGKPSTYHANARFYIVNASRSDGVIADAKGDGSFTTIPFSGVEGDTLEFYYDAPDGRRSDRICATLTIDVSLVGTTTCP